MILEMDIDITERKRAEETLVLQSLRLAILLELHRLEDASAKEVFDYCLDAVIMVTQSRLSFIGLIDENESTMSIHAWSKDAMRQCAMDDKPRHFPVAGSGLWGDCIRQRGPVLVNDYDAPLPHKKGYPAGHVPLERLLCVPVFAGERIVAVAAVANKEKAYDQEDVTALTATMNKLGEILRRKQAVAALQASENRYRRLNENLEKLVSERTAELEATNKELEAFTYSVSHDLRAPLRRIDGFAKLLMEEYSGGLADAARHYLVRVRDGTRHMGQLVDDLLNLARVGRRELSVRMTDLNSLVEAVRRELQPETAGREIEWQIGQLPFVDCDPNLLKQVFANLLSNAAKFTRPRQPAVIEVGAIEQDGHPVIFVRDNGVGFNMKYAGKLFGVFQRLHRSEDFEGTGVGLATVQRIIRKHGGRLWAEAELNKGATFYFTLGASDDQQIGNNNAIGGAA
jgi:signal transduction histidine kinase